MHAVDRRRRKPLKQGRLRPYAAIERRVTTHRHVKSVKGPTRKGQKVVARERDTQPIVSFSAVTNRTHAKHSYFSVDVSNPHVQHFLRLVAKAQSMIDSEKPQRKAS